MRAPTILGSFAIVASFACSSSGNGATSPSDAGVDPTAHGGAKFFLTVVPGSDTSNLCPDPTAQVTISKKDSDGTDKLVVNGSDHALVRCRYDDHRFDLAVSNDTGGIEATGSFVGNESKDAHLILRTPGATYQSTQPCDIVFNKGGDAMTGHFTCPTLVHESLSPRQCAVMQRDPGGTPLSFFKFTGCTGF